MIATTMNDIEKIYCNSYNHDVKAPVVYAKQSTRGLYADAAFTKPVDYTLLEELFYAGVAIKIDPENGIKKVLKATMFDWSVRPYIVADNRNYFGYDTESDEWAEPQINE